MQQKVIGNSTEPSFFNKRTNASEVKTQIVVNFFKAWSTVMKKYIGKKYNSISYWELYCGPGRYEDGQESTSLKIFNHSLAEPWLRRGLYTYFVDQKPLYTNQLEKELRLSQFYRKMDYPPQVVRSAINKGLTDRLKQSKLTPSLFFIDPFGVKGITRELLSAMIKDWGSDIIFLFNYNRFNMWVNRDDQRELIDGLIGPERAGALRNKLKGRMTSRERHKLIMNAAEQSFRSIKNSYFLPFRFVSDKQNRTSHYLFYMSKSFLGYHIMKSVMANASTRSDFGVPSMTFDSRELTQLEMFESKEPLTKLEKRIAKRFSGWQLSVWKIYEIDSPGSNYTLANYKDALVQLEVEQKLKATPFIGFRPIRKGAITMADKTMITFPLNG